MIYLIDKIQETEDMCELDTMSAILESYIKLFNIIDELDYNETIIQESGIIDTCIMEVDVTDTNQQSTTNDENKESFITKIKNMISNIVGLFKRAIDKLVNIVTNRIYRRKEFLYMVANSCALLSELSNVKSTYKESYDEDVTDDIIQEGIGDNLRFAAADARIAKAKHDQEKQKQKEVKVEQKAVEEQAKMLEQVLNEKYRNEITQRLLSKEQMKTIVSQISSRYPAKELELMNDAIRKLQNDKGTAMTDTTKKNIGFCDRLIQLETTNSREAYQQEIKDTTAEKMNESGMRDVLMRIDLINKFSDTMGKAMNDMSNTQHFSREAMMNCMYTDQPIKNMFDQVASWAAYMIKNQAKCVKAGDSLKALAAKHGKQLYEGNIAFDDEVFKDTQQRRDLNMKVNKTANVALFAINQIKEETYGWADDEKFNYRTYNCHNPITAAAGGPFTIAFKVAKIGFCLALGKPAIAAISFKAVASFLGKSFVGTWTSPLAIAAKSMNPDGYKIERERNKAENAPDAPTIDQRIGGFLM